MIRVFIGYDRRIPVAFQALVHSITARATQPVSFCPISLAGLGGLYTREANPLQSTEFSFSRFLVPHLCGYQGWAIFMDNDMIALDDISRLWALRDDKYAVMCVKHDHNPSGERKFLGAAQTQYAKKNWSSVMMFNNAKCRALTPDFVNTATGLELHQFKWLDSDDQIGALPPEWNHLVDYDDPSRAPSLLHYTSGGPFYRDYVDCGFSREWYGEFAAANNAELDVHAMADIARRKAAG